MSAVFALSARWPAALAVSFERLSRRATTSGAPGEAFGLALYRGQRATILREPVMAARASLSSRLKSKPPVSALFVGHVRQAESGPGGDGNVQPFDRTLGGRQHVFAMPRQPLPLRLRPSLDTGAHRPQGGSPAEQAFCALLHRLEVIWRDDAPAPEVEARFSCVASFVTELNHHAPASFLYGDGDVLFVYAAGGDTSGDGMYLHRQFDRVTAGAEQIGLSVAGESQDITLVSSFPIDPNGATRCRPGDLLAVQDGVPVMRQAIAATGQSPAYEGVTLAAWPVSIGK
ncbi:MAG: class II glutamine amidotransferase [Geminicoccaceae bacterium]